MQVKGVVETTEDAALSVNPWAELTALGAAAADARPVGAVALGGLVDGEAGKPNRAEQVAVLHQQIAGAVETLVEAGAWRRMLDVASRFHDYSFGNQMLISLQRPDATRVAGYRAWQKLGRQVRKGERGIAILAPVTIRLKGEEESQAGGATAAAADGTEEAEKSKVIQRFKVAHVFDIDQTDGDALPGLPNRLEGEADQALWDKLAKLVVDRGYSLIRTAEGPDGYTSPKTKTVGVRAEFDPAHATMVLMHELAHIACGHVDEGYDYRAHRGAAEVEAQSVAYIVAAALGIDATAYSTDYVIGWAEGDVALVRATAQKVTTVAREILESWDRQSFGVEG
jgi:antirestriction protein ArdC